MPDVGRVNKEGRRSSAGTFCLDMSDVKASSEVQRLGMKFYALKKTVQYCWAPTWRTCSRDPLGLIGTTWAASWKTSTTKTTRRMAVDRQIETNDSQEQLAE